MKKLISFMLAVILAVTCGTSVYAQQMVTVENEQQSGGVQLGYVEYAEEEMLYQTEYIPVESASAAAIVNSDSFVDKTADQTNFDLPCKAALLMDESTGQVLYAKNATQQLPIASITKVMTMLLVLRRWTAER